MVSGAFWAGMVGAEAWSDAKAWPEWQTFVQSSLFIMEYTLSDSICVFKDCRHILLAHQPLHKACKVMFNAQ